MVQLPNTGRHFSVHHQSDGTAPPLTTGAIDVAKAVKSTGKNVAVALATDGGRMQLDRERRRDGGPRRPAGDDQDFALARCRVAPA
jgi:hypothetical protein